jgi:hypothetical protein
MIHLLQYQDHTLGLAYLDMSHLGISDIHVLAYLMTHDGNDIWQAVVSGPHVQHHVALTVRIVHQDVEVPVLCSGIQLSTRESPERIDRDLTCP